MRVLDPACGSGNFLYVALLLLLDLWKEVSVFGSELGLPLMLPDVNPCPSPLQMHGMEINPYAHDLAQTSIWIGYIQWRRDNGFGFPIEPILKSIETIKLMDAILARDAWHLFGLGGYARYIAICPAGWKYGVAVGEVPEAPLAKSENVLRWDASQGMRVRK